MRRSSGPGGGSFAIRLCALIVAPIVALGMLALDRIHDEHVEADAVRRLVEDVRLQQRIAAVYGPAQLEQIALRGLARADELGASRDVVMELTGLDLGQIHDANAVEFDEAMDALAASFSDRPIDGGRLGVQLNVVRRSLAVQRALSDEFRASDVEVRAVFDELQQILTEALDTTRPVINGDPRPRPSNGERAQLRALGEVSLAAGGRGEALFDALIEPDPGATFAVVGASARLDAALEAFRSTLDSGQRSTLDRLNDSLRPIPNALLAVPRDSSTVDGPPAFISASASAVLDQVDYLRALERYSGEFHRSVVQTLDQRVGHAEDAVVNTQLFVVAIAVVSTLMLLVVSWTTLSPLRRLTRRAQSIGGGDLVALPLPIRGPSDIRTLTATMNEMLTTLRGIDDEVTRLAEGTIGQDGSIELPGAVGVSLRRSFEHLEAVTAQLHASEQLASAIVTQAADAIWTVDADGVIRSANDAAASMTGVPADAQIGERLDAYLSDTSNGEVTVRDRSGGTATLLVASSEILGGAERLTTVIARDISERLQLEQRLAYLAHHDALTSLPNRLAVLERLAATADRPVAVLFVDLDGFKSVNDTQGHLAGDRVLTEVAERLSTYVRPTDFVGRLGGDEFVVVISDFDEVSDVVAFGYRLVREIEQPYGDGDNLFALSSSVGVAVFDRGLDAVGLSPLEAIRQADNAVYEAKKRGRGRVELFDGELQASIVHVAAMEIALRQAVRNGELTMHLQPILDLRTRTFTGAEALVRWDRPDVGLVAPGEFIAVAERSSLIFEIGRWMILQACECLARWRVEDPLCTNTIAVNIAGRHLTDGHLLADLEAALAITGADPALLEFELTETQLMEDLQRATVVLDGVRALGVTVAVDDFGTGYSSMSYLRQLPIDTLKIDRTFVGSVTDDDFDSTVIDALLTIGHSLGLTVVAEGVERIEQLDHLISRGCDRAQGNLLAPPTGVAEAEALMADAIALPVLGPAFDADLGERLESHLDLRRPAATAAG